MAKTIKLIGFTSDYKRARKGEDVAFFMNEEGSVQFHYEYTKENGWDGSLRTYKNEDGYLLYGNITCKHFEGICNDTLVKVDVKKVVAHLTYE